MYKPAEPTIDRLERYYALVHDIEDAAKLKAAPVPKKSIAQPVGLGEMADEMAGSAAAPLALDPERLMLEMWGQGRYREVTACILVHEDGSDVTLEEAGKIKPSVVGSAVVPFVLELQASLSMFDAGALAAGFAQAMPLAAPATA